MLTLNTPSDFLQHVGRDLGESDWFTIEQRHIDGFAELTGDDFWIHVDVARAQREMPQGKTIAHGLFVLSLVPHLQRQIFKVTRRGKGLNYGSDRVRYIAAVPVGSRVRLRQHLKSADRSSGGTRITTICTFDLDGSPKPAVIAEFILLIQDE
jgi:acyl dehydratase